MLWAVAIVTMAVGSVIAIVQSDVKRMLAYSSIAHAGFILTGILALDRTGVSAVLFYLFVYGFATIGAFAHRHPRPRRRRGGTVGGEATHLSQWAGLGRRHPVVAGAFTLFLLAFAGHPADQRASSGKFAVFSAAVAHGAWVLALIGVLASAIAAFFYVRVIVLMYFTSPTGSSTVVALPGWTTSVAIAVCATVTLVLGVVPAVLLDPATGASVFLVTADGTAPTDARRRAPCPPLAGLAVTPRSTWPTPRSRPCGRPRAGRAARCCRPSPSVTGSRTTPLATSSWRAASGCGPCSRSSPPSSATRPARDRRGRRSSWSSRTWRRCTTTTSWTPRRCAAAPRGARGLGQHRGHPHRRPALRPGLPVVAGLGAEAVRIQAPTFERLCLGQLHETVGPRRGRRPRRALPAGPRRQDRLADRDLGAVRRHVRRLPPEVLDVVAAYGEKVGVAFQLADDVIDLTSDGATAARRPGPTCASASRRCPCCCCADTSRRPGTAPRGSCWTCSTATCRATRSSRTWSSAWAEHPATAQARDEAVRWAREAVTALDPLPPSPARDALRAYAEAVVARTT